MRLHQWVKNALVFVPLMLGGKVGDAATWQLACVGFLAFGLTASGTYILNDIWDMRFDRDHAIKRLRPIASGAIAIAPAACLAVVCLGLGLALGSWLGREPLLLMLAYVVLTLAYTIWLKRLVIVDVLVIAALFSLRLAFGTAVADVRWSFWIFLLSLCSFLSLALVKRFAELPALSSEPDNKLPGRGYAPADRSLVGRLGGAAAVGAVIVMMMYLISEAFPHEVYKHPYRLWAVPAVLALFFGRVWYAALQGEKIEDPVAFALRDWLCLGSGALLIAVYVSAIM